MNKVSIYIYSLLEVKTPFLRVETVRPGRPPHGVVPEVDGGTAPASMADSSAVTWEQRW